MANLLVGLCRGDHPLEEIDITDDYFSGVSLGAGFIPGFHCNVLLTKLIVVAVVYKGSI